MAGLLLLSTGTILPSPVEAGHTESDTFIVTAAEKGEAKGKVHRHGGRVEKELHVVRGVVARLNPQQRDRLADDADVVVTPNVPVSLTDLPVATTRPPAAVFPTLTGADRLAAKGITGAGVTVAVLDTGIARLPDFSGRLVSGVDLSGEGNPYRDSFGHGTFVAGLIAGNGASSAGLYKGEAPGARLVPVKVAGASGSTDLARVIAGIDWVVANRLLLNIRVLNVSLGAVMNRSTVLNPLDLAVEAAWRSGIVVVASAGNAGPFNGTVTSPGDDPLILTAGALDDRGTADAADDAMAEFSSVGPTAVDGWYKPDLVASGRSVVSLRVPGSTIDTTNPSARIGTANFVGSGTSFSAAVASGAAALVLDARPWARPDEVKGRLVGTAATGPVGNPFVDGGGSLDAYRAAVVSDIGFSQAALSNPTATLPGTTVSLSVTWNSSPWNGSAWNGSAWNGSAWNGSAWNGSAWNGSAWNGSAWNGSAWNGSAWNGSAWNGSAWNGSAWNGSAWNGSAWNGSAWNGSAWNGSAWNGSAWNGSAWN
ncbi:MAG TPA: S8 family serine peptidase [Acidimicrobiales bacterium]|nr:S8 family serine peptidase [Acidimicrobiales bacterium]